MSLRYSLLGLLAEENASGYDITLRFKETLGGVWPASHPQIYRELTKLAEEGLVKASESGPRGRKDYEITSAGLAAVRKWLAHSDPDHTFRSEALIRSYFFWLMSSKDITEYLEGERKFFEERAAQYQKYADAKDRGEYGDSKQTHAARITVEAAIKVNTALSEWAIWAQKRTEGGL